MNVVYSGVQSFTQSGVISDSGSNHDGDVAICATGFDTSYVSRYPIYGPSGRNLQTEWAESIMGYMGVGIAEFPNSFTSKKSLPDWWGHGPGRMPSADRRGAPHL